MRILWVGGGVLFFYFMHRRAPRTTLQRSAKLRELAERADGIRFDAAVTQVPDVADDMQAVRQVLCEKPEAHALDQSRDKEASRLFRVAHKPGDCSREPLHRAPVRRGSVNLWRTAARSDLR